MQESTVQASDTAVPAVLSSQPIRLTGRIAAVRNFHKRLRFVDIVQDLEPGAESTSGEHVQVVFREGHDNVRINPGDQLDVLGTYDPNTSKQKKSYQVVEVLAVERLRLRINYKEIVGHFPGEETKNRSEGSEVGGDAGQKKQPVLLCREWLRGRCRQSDESCKNRHYCVTPEEQRKRKRLSNLREKEAKKVKQLADTNDPFEHDDKLHKGARTKIFAQWLVDTFGRERLNSGTGVIDIAGGKGMLLYELVCKQQVETATVDPRPMKLSSSQKKFVRKHLQPQGQELRHYRRYFPFGPGATLPAAEAVAAGDALPPEEKAAGQTSVGSEDWRDGGAGQAKDEDEKEKKQWQEEEEQRKRIRKQKQDEKYDEEGVDLAARLDACSMVVGMHPDQVTEAVIDYALANDKSFAVVPCCVFPSLFPQRYAPASYVTVLPPSSLLLHLQVMSLYSHPPRSSFTCKLCHCTPTLLAPPSFWSAPRETRALPQLDTPHPTHLPSESGRRGVARP
jgi:hypothetical protein